ncbi:hypothetical protein [Aromatoleum toluvorans]|uniref:hypothetical protein n=1 Tax=Aromatoleum toluvorans TaxID=92002 RepID=UPI001B7D0013|nr:hypothetical protein [Aromatoleum toluvorans]
MPEHFQWVPFLLAITLLTMTPGVDTFMVIRNAARGGWRGRAWRAVWTASPE